MWRDETEPIKTQWKDKAENVKRQHLRDHPDYQYQPRKPHEKKRRMTKRKAQVLAAQQASASTSTTGTLPTHATVPTSTTTFSPMAPVVGPFSSVTSPSQLVDLANFDDPTFDFAANNELANFTLDTFEPGQLDLFANLLETHNAEFQMPQAPAFMPAAITALPTAINHAQAGGIPGAINNHINNENSAATAHDLATAEIDLNNFEASLEDLLSRELETMEQDGGAAFAADNQQMPMGFQYNDFESQRFTEFLEQMPEHMWGMEFVN
uniref:MAT1-2-1 n=1 Tax=Aureobasidium zeae TaxID=1592451 RepID=A0A5P8DHP2_9PEZI|nr:MAT1-2-1 [Aureobasidium zeae]